MGTNYYARVNCCSHCNRYDQIHIGKSSMGWAFSFRGYTKQGYFSELPERFEHLTIRSFQDWKTFLENPDVNIYDEYGDQISKEDFFSLVKAKQGGKVSANEYSPYIDKSTVWVDDEGNSFSSTEFS